MEAIKPINPYAAPKAQSLLAEDGRDGPPRRPRAVKWVTFIFTLFFLVQVSLYWRTITAYGVQKVWQSQSLFDPFLLLPMGFALSWFGGRHKIAYYVNSGLLAMIALKMVWNIFFVRWASSGAFAGMFLPDRVVEAVMCGLLCFIFYRFIFGLPSRRYFGLDNDMPAASA